MLSGLMCVWGGACFGCEGTVNGVFILGPKCQMFCVLVRKDGKILSTHLSSQNFEIKP